PISISSFASEPHTTIDTSTTSMESGNSNIPVQVPAVNTHLMITRSKRGIFKLKTLTAAARNLDECEPTSNKQALSHPA
ncbi:hypothetical protein PanWU01x14_255080, partial [Parasponia andersonii]